MPTANDAQQFIGKLAANNIKAITVGKSDVRFVTHLDFTDEMLEKVLITINKIYEKKSMLFLLLSILLK